MGDVAVAHQLRGGLEAQVFQAGGRVHHGPPAEDGHRGVAEVRHRVRVVRVLIGEVLLEPQQRGVCVVDVAQYHEILHALVPEDAARVALAAGHWRLIARHHVHRHNSCHAAHVEGPVLSEVLELVHTHTSACGVGEARPVEETRPQLRRVHHHLPKRVRVVLKHLFEPAHTQVIAQRRLPACAVGTVQVHSDRVSRLHCDVHVVGEWGSEDNNNVDGDLEVSHVRYPPKVVCGHKWDFVIEPHR
mmetsp:Transcript_28779/g.55159  ORF Transcript_28779/g.55159 Transcript_28779/m.55159 type:complete len:245 (+) Transcript_28779:409-1143(+)